jgi:hypothetical protein
MSDSGRRGFQKRLNIIIYSFAIGAHIQIAKLNVMTRSRADCKQSIYNMAELIIIVLRHFKALITRGTEK